MQIGKRANIGNMTTYWEYEFELATATFLTNPTNQPKLTNRDNYQLMSYISDLDEIWTTSNKS